MLESALLAERLLSEASHTTPYLNLDLDKVRENVQEVRSAFSALNPRIYYSCKANADTRLLSVLLDEGCGFDVASINEIARLDRAGISGEDAIFSSTIKIPEHIAAAYARGVNTFALDSQAEVMKLQALAPRSQIVVRMDVPHRGSRWPLAGKFGVSPREAVELLCQAREAGLKPHGLTFHVGSQCERTRSWRDALEICAKTWRLAEDAGIQLRFLNLGGGLPATYGESVPTVEEIGAEVSLEAPRLLGPDVEYAIEPGRFLVASAGVLVTTVIGKAMRKGKRWLFVDLGIYSGLLEVIGGWSYPMLTAKEDAPVHTTTLSGPSCDSTDIIAKNVQLPDLELGDRILLLSAGAYTTAYKEYNGFEFPKVFTVGKGVRRLSAVA